MSDFINTIKILIIWLIHPLEHDNVVCTSHKHSKITCITWMKFKVFWPYNSTLVLLVGGNLSFKLGLFTRGLGV